MAPPIRAPMLLSGSGSLPSATADALGALAPTGSGAVGGAQVIRVGDVPSRSGDLRSASINGQPTRTRSPRRSTGSSAPPHGQGELRRRDRLGRQRRVRDAGRRVGRRERRPGPVRQRARRSRRPPARRCWPTRSPHIYVLGPPSVIPDSVAHAARQVRARSSGSARRIRRRTRSRSPSYRDPACPYGQPCAHVPGSFGWAMRSPGHGYVLINANRTLDAAAAAPLSGSGDYGPQLLIDNPATLPPSVLELLPQLRDARLHPGGPDRRRVQPRLGDRRPDARSRSRCRPRWTALLEAVPQTAMSQAENPERLAPRARGRRSRTCAS